MGKRKKNFLPKRVGRLKIPKRLRRGVVGAAIASPAGQAVIAALILQAGAHLLRQAVGARDGAASLETWLDRGAGDFAGGSPLGHEASAAPPRADGFGPATTARRGAQLNVKHALGQAALAFILGLSHAPGEPRRPKRPSDQRNGAAADAQSVEAQSGAAVARPEPEKLGAHSH